MSTNLAHNTALAAMERHVINGLTMGTHFCAIACCDFDFDPDCLKCHLQSVVDLVDNQMSTWKPQSDLMRLNNAPVDQWVCIPMQLHEVLRKALEIQSQSNGAFDISVGEAVNAWGFGVKGTEPDLKTIALQGCENVPNTPEFAYEIDYEINRARRLAPRQLDLCGIAKGYGVDLMARAMEMAGIENYLVSIDGELLTRGVREDGNPWCVAIETPDPTKRQAAEYVELCNVAVATSGSYRHRRRIGDLVISHTMDGRTLKPVLNELNSVTVFADNCMEADAWATALMVLGQKQGQALANRLGIQAMFATV